MKFTVTKNYEYSIVFNDIEADSASQAEDIADEMDHDNVQDEMLIETLVDEDATN
jgi:hypothetical protein